MLPIFPGVFTYKTQINNSNLTIILDHKVVRLHILVQITCFVELFDGLEHLNREFYKADGIGGVGLKVGVKSVRTVMEFEVGLGGRTRLEEASAIETDDSRTELIKNSKIVILA